MSSTFKPGDVVIALHSNATVYYVHGDNDINNFIYVNDKPLIYLGIRNTRFEGRYFETMFLLGGHLYTSPIDFACINRAEAYMTDNFKHV